MIDLERWPATVHTQVPLYIIQHLSFTKVILRYFNLQCLQLVTFRAGRKEVSVEWVCPSANGGMSCSTFSPTLRDVPSICGIWFRKKPVHHRSSREQQSRVEPGGCHVSDRLECDWLRRYPPFRELITMQGSSCARVFRTWLCSSLLVSWLRGYLLSES